MEREATELEREALEHVRAALVVVSTLLEVPEAVTLGRWLETLADRVATLQTVVACERHVGYAPAVSDTASDARTGDVPSPGGSGLRRPVACCQPAGACWEDVAARVDKAYGRVIAASAMVSWAASQPAGARLPDVAGPSGAVSDVLARWRSILADRLDALGAVLTAACCQPTDACSSSSEGWGSNPLALLERCGTGAGGNCDLAVRRGYGATVRRCHFSSSSDTGSRLGRPCERAEKAERDRDKWRDSAFSSYAEALRVARVADRLELEVLRAADQPATEAATDPSTAGGER